MPIYKVQIFQEEEEEEDYDSGGSGGAALTPPHSPGIIFLGGRRTRGL